LVLNRERKIIIIVGAILLILGLVYRFSGELGQVGRTTDSNIIMKRNKIIKYQQRAQQQKTLESRHLALRRMLAQLESTLLEAQTPALAAVDIQNILNRLAEDSKVEIRSIQVLKTRENEILPYKGILMRINFTSTLRQLKEMLYQIESSPKFLRIVNMHSRVANSRQPDQLSSIMTIEGFMLSRNFSE